MPNKPTYDELERQNIKLKQQNDSLKRYYRSVVDNSMDAMLLTAPGGDVFFVNQAACDLFQMTEQEIIDGGRMALLDEEDDRLPKALEERERTGKFVGELNCKKRDGTIFPGEISSSIFKDTEGQPLTSLIIRDVTERTKMEDALRDSEEKYRKLYEDAAIGIFHSTFNGRFLDLNPALAKMLGYETPQEVLDSIYSIAEQVYVEPQARDEVIAQSLAKRETIKVENRYRRKDGSEWNAYLHLRYVFDSDGNPCYLEGFAEDITERKQIDEILHKKHEMLKHTEAMANIGSWEWDVQHDQAYWSEELFRIFGRGPAEGAPSFAEQSKFYANGDIQRLRDAVDACVNRGAPYEIELRAIRTDGEIRHCVSRGKALYDENGKVLRLVGSFQDITDRKHSENHIKALERRNQALLDHSPVCHKIVDIDFNLQYMSASGFKMLKIDENSVVYGKPYPFYFFPETFKSEMRKNLEKVINTGETVTMEALTNDFQGNDVWLDSSLIPVVDDNNNIEYITVVSANATQRKHDEKEKDRLEGQLRQAQKMEAVGRLAGGVAHDFNNMLSVILGHTEMALERLDPSQPLYQDLEEVLSAGQRSADLTRQLLAYARKQTVAPKVLDLHKTVSGMIRMLQRLMGEDIDLRWRPGEKIWRVKIDPSQVDQILANLCVNARDAIEGVGKVTIETGTAVFAEAYCADHPEFFPGEYMMLAVSDDGCGMTPEVLENIFDPFYSSKEAGKGTGLGLSTVYGVVKQNNGFINVYSEPEQGTTFKIYLPRHRTKKSHLPGKEEVQSIDRGYETILLVEDEPSILRMTAMMLEKLGYRVLKAMTPGEAIQTAHECTDAIHLLLTDVVMPEMNGRDLAKNIMSSYPNLKRLFMSGYTANVIAHQGVLDDGVNFIQKPFSKEQLGAKVREALDGGKA